MLHEGFAQAQAMQISQEVPAWRGPSLEAERLAEQMQIDYRIGRVVMPSQLQSTAVEGNSLAAGIYRPLRAPLTALGRLGISRNW
jgi:hypothetical protein